MVSTIPNSMYSYLIISIAWLIIITDMYLLYKNKENPLLLISNFFIFYFNYSICVGEYIAHNMIVPKNDLYYTMNGNIYEVGIIVLLIFTIIRFLFLNKQIIYKPIEGVSNVILFYALYLFLIYIGIFQVNRESSILYEVKIKPMYEYSVLVFALLLYYQGDSKIRNILSYLIALFFILQDTYYGGRATSLQIVILFMIFKHEWAIRLKYVIICFPFALFLFTIVGFYRSSYNLDFSLIDIYNEITNGLFVQDTAVYAYFASMTHINARIYTEFTTELSSFIAFIQSVIFGSSGSSIFNHAPDLSLVSKISQKYHWNVGGGLFMTWYFFWFGYSGLVLLSSVMMFLFRQVLLSNKNLNKFILIGIIITTPRWYLYSPLAFFRGPFIFMPLLILCCFLVDKILKVNSRKKFLAQKVYNQKSLSE